MNGAMDAMTAPVSLYEPVYSDGGDPLTVMDQVRDREEHRRAAGSRSIALRQAIQELGDRERRILALRFYDGRTQMEVAGQVGISQAQVSRLEKNALRAIPQGDLARHKAGLCAGICLQTEAYAGGCSEWSTGFPSCATRRSSTSARGAGWGI